MWTGKHRGVPCPACMRPVGQVIGSAGFWGGHQGHFLNNFILAFNFKFIVHILFIFGWDNISDPGTGGDSCAILTKSKRIAFRSYLLKKTLHARYMTYRSCNQDRFNNWLTGRFVTPGQVVWRSQFTLRHVWTTLTTHFRILSQIWQPKKLFSLPDQTSATFCWGYNKTPASAQPHPGAARSLNQ